MSNSSSEKNSDFLGGWFSSGEIFLRRSDRVRFENVFLDVVQKRRHLALFSDSDGVVDHYGKMLLNRLRTDSRVTVEVYFPASIESLLIRFNELVATLSIEEARSEPNLNSPGRIMFVNDAKAIDVNEWTLLAQLVNDFPGLDIRIVVLLDKLTTQPEKLTDRFGSRLVRWDVLPPSESEVIDLRQAAQEIGLEYEVDRVVKRLSRGGGSRHDDMLDEPQKESNLNQKIDQDEDDISKKIVPEDLIDEYEALQVLFSDAEEEKPKSARLPWFSMILVLLGSIGLASSYNMDQLYRKGVAAICSGTVENISYGSLRNENLPMIPPSLQMSGPLISGSADPNLALNGTFGLSAIQLSPLIESKESLTKLDPSGEEAVTIAAMNLDSAQEYDFSDSNSSAEEALASLLSPRLTLAEELEIKSDTNTELRPSKKPVMSEEKNQSDLTSINNNIENRPIIAAINGSKILNQEIIGAKIDNINLEELSIQEETASPENLSGESNRNSSLGESDLVVDSDSQAVAKVMSAPSRSLFVQHFVSANRRSAEDLKQEEIELADAFILPVLMSEKVMYAVVSGPFSSRREALGYVRDAEISRSYWIRFASSLQRVTADAD